MTDSHEQWKPVAGFPGYEVSDQGRVRTLTRYIHSWRSERKIPGVILKPYKNKLGYLSVKLYIGNRGTNKMVYRLVADAFIPNPLGLSTVNHIDGRQKDNNSVSNLEWRSQQGQVQHALKTGLIKITGERYLRGWIARSKAGGLGRVHLGYFDRKEDAIAALKAYIADIPYCP